MNNPLISVVVPVYNCEKYIERCVNSIIGQSYKNLEIILVDDGSKDNSFKIIKELEKKDFRIRVFSQQNQGSSVARNLGIENSHGEYVSFIDSDDFVAEDYINTYVTNIHGNDIIIGGHTKYGGEDKKSLYFYKNNDLSKYLLCPPWGRMFNLNFIKENKIEFPKGLFRQDSIFNMRAFNLTRKISYLHYEGYYYNLVNEQAVTKNQFKKFDPRFIEWLDLILKIRPIDKKNNEMKEYAIIRSIVLYLLYSGKSATNREFLVEYKKLFGWLKDNIPNYWRNKYFFTFDDGVLYKLGVGCFILLDKLNLLPIFFRLIKHFI